MSAPTWDVISARVGRLVAERDGEWSGLPMPVEGLTLTVEPKNPWRGRIAELEKCLNKPKPERPDDGVRVVNQWYSRRLRGNVVIARDGQKTFGVQVDHDTGIKFSAAFGTLQASQVWSFDAELTAQQKFCALVPDHIAESYIMTGAFLETSKRSAVTYLFRRCRPTLALRPDASGEMRALCALCLHPIGYYEGTWAGSMVPTDEVIAHLMLMRGDEPLYWRRANQHSVWSPLAGI